MARYVDLDDYTGPLTLQARPCTCAGTAPGYPQHEACCGQDDGDPDDGELASLHDYQDTHEPEED